MGSSNFAAVVGLSIVGIISCILTIASVVVTAVTSNPFWAIPALVFGSFTALCLYRIEQTP